MSDQRKAVECSYCGAQFSIKWSEEEDMKPSFCVFCSEAFENPNEEVEDEDDNGDMDDIEEDLN
jgi:Zn ribbon nucleic-acid-binding protein